MSLPVDQEVAELALQFGYKTANLMVLNKLPDVAVPEFHGISHDKCLQHLDQHAPQWRSLWEQFKALQGDSSGLVEGTHKILEALRQEICHAFSAHPLRDSEFQHFVSSLKSRDLLMIRSTGKEDTAEIANPGGNESYPCNPQGNDKRISEFVGMVIASYFSVKSLEQRMKARNGESIQSDPFMPVLLQRMIGEEPDSTNQKMICSGVMYTHKKGTRIDVAPGHGELVVNSKGLIDSYFITAQGVVHQQINRKAVRLALALDNGKATLKLKRNNNSIQNGSSLSPSVVHRLNEIGKAIEAKYGAPRDIEFVYDLNVDKIYIVQARPMPAGLSANIIPSAIAPEKIKSVKATRPFIKAKTIAPAGSCAQIVQQKNELLICNTIGEALDDYLNMTDVSAIKAVIVYSDAPRTSHEAAEFNSLAVPVLYVTKSESHKVEQYLQQDPLNLIIDPQRGLVVSGQPNDETLLLKEGFFKSSIPAERTLDTKTLQIDTQKSQQALNIAKKGEFLLRKSNVYEHMLDLLETIEGTQPNQVSIDEAKKSLGALLSYFYVLAKESKDPNNQVRRNALFQHAAIYAINIDHLLNKIANKTHLSASAQKELLDLANGLEALIANPGRKNLFSDSLFQTVFEIKAQRELTSLYKDETFKELSNATKAGISQLHRLGKVAANQALQKKWDDFVLRIAHRKNKDADPTLLNHLMNIAHYVVSNDLGSTLINHVFRKCLDKPDVEILRILTNETKDSNHILEANNFWELEAKITEWEAKISAWKNADGFDRLKAAFDKDFKDILTKLHGFNNIADLPAMTQTKVLGEITRLTEIMDTSIKVMKGSLDYQDRKDEQVLHFKSMLDNYHQLMDWSIKCLSDKNHTTKYIQYKRKAIKEAYKKKAAHITPRDLSTSGRFEVNSVTIDAVAQFNKSFDGELMTLEDYFTLFHQNILAALNRLGSHIQVDSELFPDNLKELHKGIKQFEVRKMSNNSVQVGIAKVTQDSIFVDYNIPLALHAARIFLEHNKNDNNLTVKFDLYGENVANRMGQIFYFINNYLQAAYTKERVELLERGEYVESKFSGSVKFMVKDYNSGLIHDLLELLQTALTMTFDREIDLSFLEKANYTADFRCQLLEVLSRETNSFSQSQSWKLIYFLRTLNEHVLENNRRSLLKAAGKLYPAHLSAINAGESQITEDNFNGFVEKLRLMSDQDIEEQIKQQKINLAIKSPLENFNNFRLALENKADWQDSSADEKISMLKMLAVHFRQLNGIPEKQKNILTAVKSLIQGTYLANLEESEKFAILTWLAGDESAISDELFKLLLKMTADINFMSEETGTRLIEETITSNALKKFHMVLKNPNLQLDAENLSGMTPLNIAIRMENVDMINALILKGANTDSALTYAISNEASNNIIQVIKTAIQRKNYYLLLAGIRGNNFPAVLKKAMCDPQLKKQAIEAGKHTQEVIKDLYEQYITEHGNDLQTSLQYRRAKIDYSEYQ